MGVKRAACGSGVARFVKHCAVLRPENRISGRDAFYVRLLAFFVAAYALSPIDLSPDFIPVLGYLDNVILIPLGLALAVKLTPPEILASAQLQVKEAANKPVSYTAAGFIVLLWLAVLWVVVRWIIGLWRG